MLRLRPVHASKLERYVGAEDIALMSRLMRDWYGPHIALAGVPGEVYACGGGDFVGRLDCGEEASVLDRADEMYQRLKRALRVTINPERRLVLNAGFSGLSAIRTLGRATRQDFPFQYPSTGAGGAGTGIINSMWFGNVANSAVPANGTNASGPPGGRVPVGGTNGGFKFRNPPSGYTTHLITASVFFNPARGAMLLYDRIFDVAHTPSDTSTQVVTGVPTRYQNTSAGQPDSAAGNFCFPEAETSQLATQNWNVCLYNNQAGAASTFPSAAGPVISSNNICLGAYQWFLPLATGDTGVQALTQMQSDASVANALNFVMGHPIAWFPSIVVNMVSVLGGVSSSLQLARIFDDACLTSLYVRGTTGQSELRGIFTAAAG